MVSHTEIATWILNALVDAKRDINRLKSRQLLLVQGRVSWCLQEIETVLSTLTDINGGSSNTNVSISSLYIGYPLTNVVNNGSLAVVEEYIQPSAIKSVLGRELDLIFIDLFSCFDMNVMLAASGAVKSGGTLVLLAPPNQDAPSLCASLQKTVSHGFQLEESYFAQLFFSRLHQCIDNCTIRLWSEHELPISRAVLTTCGLNHENRSTKTLVNTNSTIFENLVAAVEQGKISLLVGPRGSGKSTLLGRLAAYFIKQNNVILISNARDSIGSAIRHFEHDADDAIKEHAPFQWKTPQNFRFNCVPPDTFLAEPTRHAASIVLVDEAASITLAQLALITQRAERLVLATTTEGYEGSGQGFWLKFIPSLRNHRALREFSLSSAFRFAFDDGLSTVINYTSLNLRNQRDEKTLVQNKNPVLENLVIESFKHVKQLPTEYLDQVIQLMQDAHYQTTPNDIMRIIDAPDVYHFIALHNDNVLGYALVNIEGSDKLADVATDISCGKRRVKGHLTSQQLCYHFADEQLALLSNWRINRIAVVPNYQRLSIGSTLTTAIERQALAAKIDVLSSSFAYSAATSAFWNSNDFTCLKVGTKKDNASGAASMIVAKPISSHAKTAFATVHYIANQDMALTELSSDIIARTNSELARSTADESLVKLTHFKRLKQFADGSRHPDYLGASFEYVHGHHETLLEFLSSQGFIFEAKLLTDYFLNRIPLREIVAQHKLTGRKMAINQLRNAVAAYLRLSDEHILISQK